MVGCLVLHPISVVYIQHTLRVRKSLAILLLVHGSKIASAGETFQHLQFTLSKLAVITCIHRSACELSIVHARYMYAYSQGRHDPLGSHCHHHVHQLLRVLPEQANNCLLCAVGGGAAATTPAMALHQLLHHWSTAETER